MDSLKDTPIRKAPQAYYERDSHIIPSGFWPARLIELAMARSLPEHKILRNTSIFCEDINHPDHRISPEQLLQLIKNIDKHSSTYDLSFLFGQQLLPGNIADISEQLNTANNLNELIDLLLEHQSLFCPLLNIRRRYEGDQLVLYWQDACGAEEALIFLLETMATAISSLVRWLSGSRLPWTIYFSHKRPEYIEQYQVHLSADIQFECQCNAMAIARDYCFVPWPKKTLQLSQHSFLLMMNVDHVTAPSSRGFLTEVHNYLNHNIASDPDLEKTAADFGMSSASFKRKLKKHHSHFQALYDQVRKDLAVYWIHQEGWSNEQVAQKLHFHDVANLRRAFKKWTGLTPLAVRR